MSKLETKPIKIYPRLTSGRFNNLRVSMVVLTQLVFFGLPWLQWNGRQAVHFNLAEHHFLIFGISLWPQDFIYLAALLVVCALGLFLWTTLAGRLWCGYSCPQTVYTQIMIWIERLVLGDHNARRKLDAAPGSLAKYGKKGLCQLLMGAFSLWTGLTFVGYFTPMRELAAFNMGPWDLFWTLFYAGFTWLLAGVLREKVCLHMCPYARFQGAMFDDHTLVISYDAKRGEPRGKQQARSQAPVKGCIDCGICVQVCPTGIDIRDGLQYECIGCAACIDACDQVMDKIQAPRGLISYTSAQAQQGKPAPAQSLHRPRIVVYSCLLAGIITLSTTALVLKKPFKVDVLRDRSSLVEQTDDGLLQNRYNLRLINTTEQAQRYSLAVEGLPGIKLDQPAQIVTVKPAQTETVAVRVQAEPEHATRGAHPIYFVIRSLGDDITIKEKSSFIGE
ncbi:cytochrome c oxidase accessory protein CcoG [Chromobacterium sphagni]|uniref:Cytochrome c oxidase accessory protein CcoG n=1 Tax=Chromobacterium sphagni TaxID=1903179 RepID=A0A1S1X6C1_9NEIS|nr:cytochrome c oxidase accessory protein CcoG [Chromobacterium sphagni]OHX15034.1 cytochrome c oxidase accessory protein CcoG [Chromobacterium sphagni]OHX16345.1 cytochrome c oxidase accessory protein CcoG [Chromobacterium sphagni]